MKIKITAVNVQERTIIATVIINTGVRDSNDKLIKVERAIRFQPDILLTEDTVKLALKDELDKYKAEVRVNSVAQTLVGIDYDETEL